VDGRGDAVWNDNAGSLVDFVAIAQESSMVQDVLFLKDRGASSDVSILILDPKGGKQLEERGVVAGIKSDFSDVLLGSFYDTHL
jgi:hypothetical protein